MFAYEYNGEHFYICSPRPTLAEYFGKDYFKNI